MGAKFSDMLIIDHLTGMKFSVFKNKAALDRFESLLAEQHKEPVNGSMTMFLPLF